MSKFIDLPLLVAILKLFPVRVRLVQNFGPPYLPKIGHHNERSLNSIDLPVLVTILKLSPVRVRLIVSLDPSINGTINDGIP